MHPTARLQFERIVREYTRWRSVPDEERSPAPAWWWQPALQVIDEREEMAPLWCQRLELPIRSTFAQGARVLMATLADQTKPTHPDEFPRKVKSPVNRIAAR
jgi:hypothetical protein